MYHTLHYVNSTNLYCQCFVLSIKLLIFPPKFRRSVANMYQSTGSLHSDGHSSNSMSPAPSSPSPTHAQLMRHGGSGHHPHHHHHPHSRSSTAPIRGATAGTPSRGQAMPPPPPPGTPSGKMSGSMTNLSLSGSKRWNSTSDFREQSPGPRYVISLSPRYSNKLFHRT